MALVRILAAGAALSLAFVSPAAAEGPTVRTKPETGLQKAERERFEAEAAARRAYQTHTPFQSMPPLRYYPDCREFVGKGGPIAGVVLGPSFMGAGVATLVVGAPDKDAVLMGVGGALLGVGLATMIATAVTLRHRNEARRDQALLGCPPYR
jgi:hypothetical protein